MCLLRNNRAGKTARLKNMSSHRGDIRIHNAHLSASSLFSFALAARAKDHYRHHSLLREIFIATLKSYNSCRRERDIAN
jgi:hypothetical protein